MAPVLPRPAAKRSRGTAGPRALQLQPQPQPLPLPLPLQASGFFWRLPEPRGRPKKATSEVPHPAPNHAKGPPITLLFKADHPFGVWADGCRPGLSSHFGQTYANFRSLWKKLAASCRYLLKCGEKGALGGTPICASCAAARRAASCRAAAGSPVPTYYIQGGVPAQRKNGR